METRTITVGGVELAVAEAGRGGRPILLVHGFCGAKEDFTDWLDRLATLGWHAVSYDQRGHGRSGHPAGEAAFSLRIFADDVLAVADDLGWDRFVLLGHSMGGMVAQLLALDAPERLDGLILMDTSHGAPDGLDPSLVAMAHQIVRSGGMEALIEVQRSMDPEFLASGPHLRLCEQRPGYREFCEHKTVVTSPDMWITMSDEMLSQRDRLEALRGLSLPVLVIAGQEDQGFVGQCRAMAATIPGARLAEITGGGHSPQFEAPEQWWEAVCAFLWEVNA